MAITLRCYLHENRPSNESIIQRARVLREGTEFDDDFSLLKITIG